MNKRVMYIIILVFVFMLVGCGPSPEEIATQTASAWTLTPSPTNTPTLTPTLTPTNTPTPIPFDLTVSVIDADSKPVIWANVIFSESGDEQPIVVDDAGQVSWANLPDENVSLVVNAQGYYVVELTDTIQRGQNDISIVLERDPNQIHPSEACQEGQELLYVEDFEDGKAQGWQDIIRPKWAFETIEDLGTVLTINAENEGGRTGYRGDFGNAVWLFDITTGDVKGIEINWHVSETARYTANYSANDYLELFFWTPTGQENTTWNSLGFISPPPLNDGNWHQFAFSYYDGTVDIWVDDQLQLGVEHNDNPVEAGGFGFAFGLLEEPISINNVIVCGLNEPYQPLVEGE